MGAGVPGRTGSQAGCVFGVSKDDALEWSIGRIDDYDLILKSELKAEAVFLLNLPDHVSYKRVLQAIRRLWQQGACFMVTRTGNKLVSGHILKKNPDCKIMHMEQLGACRFLVPPHAFDRWVKSWS